MNATTLDFLTGKMDVYFDLAVKYGTNLLVAVLILFIGLWLADRLTKSMKKILLAKKVEPSLLSFLTSLVSIVLKIVVVVIVLTTVGIEMTSIVAILGAASLAIGMALSGTLQNFAGGVVILLFKPFKVDDFIETQSGFSGVVEAIYIFTTRMKTADNKVVYLPNGALSNGVVTNFNQKGVRRVDLTYSIAYGNDVAKAKQVILDMLNQDSRIHKDPEPVVFLSTLAESSVKILVRYWADAGDVFPSQFDLNERVYNEFGKHGLSFPFPQMDVHVKNN